METLSIEPDYGINASNLSYDETVLMHMTIRASYYRRLAEGLATCVSYDDLTHAIADAKVDPPVAQMYWIS